MNLIIAVMVRVSPPPINELTIQTALMGGQNIIRRFLPPCPNFGLLVTSALAFKARMGPLVSVLYHLCVIDSSNLSLSETPTDLLEANMTANPLYILTLNLVKRCNRNSLL